jgi:hypothetical protein
MAFYAYAECCSAEFRLAAALGAPKVMTVIALNSVTLCCAA